ncbi:MAG: alpha/beta fold hydrolase [Dehalococcoidales bacterium]|nr:alpha/beta fold hydrolase [Dehalococcoidales bacterium]
MVETSEDRYIRVGNIYTRYRVEGDTGPVVLLVHGLGGSLENWEANISALAQQYRVYSIDLWGFGRSDKKPRLRSFDELIEFLVEFMKIQNIGKASLIGHSMGGGLVLQTAIEYPEKVEKLVLVDNAGMGRDVIIDFRVCSLPLFGELITRSGRNNVERAWKKIVYNPDVITDELLEKSYRLALLPDAMKSLLTVIRAGINLRGQRMELVLRIMEKIDRISAPILIFWGREDRIIPVAHARIAASRIPNARLHIFERCGHMPQLEYPEDFNRLALEFLAE